MAIIKSGTYKFNDVLSQPANRGTIEENMDFSITSSINGITATFYGSRIVIGGNTENDGTGFGGMFDSCSIDVSALGITFPYGANLYYEGWFTEVFGEGVSTITITEDQEVSEEFMGWFMLNANPAVTIKYNNALIASLLGGQSATLECAEMLMEDNIIINTPEIETEVIPEWDGSHVISSGDDGGVA